MLFQKLDQPFDCIFFNLHLIKEIQSEFLSEFHFMCVIRHTKEIIRTELFTHELVPTNLVIVTSTVHNGQSYSNIEQFSVSLNMPCMSNLAYQKLHNEVGEKKIKFTTCYATSEVTKEEAKTARENGDISKNGIFMINVVFDGA